MSDNYEIKNTEIKVSVIVPVFNASKHLSKTLDSIANQTLKELEIICIDDGSTDNSPEILKNYADKDKRLIVISQKNQGVSAARNAGLSIAKGKYIQFVDSDDILKGEAIQKLYEKAQETNADITLFCHNRIAGNVIKYNNLKELRKYNTNRSNLMNLLPFSYYVWDKLIKFSFLKENNIEFLKDAVSSEDGQFMLNCFSKNPDISTLEEILYIYNDTENSSTHRLNWTGHSIDTFYKILNSDIYKKADEKFKRFIIDKYVYSLIYWFDNQKHQERYRKSNKKKLENLVTYLYKNIDKKIIKNRDSIDKLKQLIEYRTLPQKIFSVKKYPKFNKTYKVLSLSGIKIKFNIKTKKQNTSNKMTPPKQPLKRSNDDCDCMIVNLWFVVNYGASLTCYGVKCLLEKLGCKTKVVNFVSENFRAKYNNSFARVFAEKYLNLTSECKTYDDLLALNNHCNNFISGSDQIWSYSIQNLHHQGATPYYYYLDFVSSRAKKISYAASIGDSSYDNVPMSYLQMAEHFLKQFDAVSVRENRAAEMLKEYFNLDSYQLIDGAFHIPEEQLNEMTSKYDSKEDYILVFRLPYFNPDSYNNTIDLISQKLNLPVKKMIFNPDVSIEEWLAAIKNAKFVLTNSFHAVVFSIIFNIPFIQLINATLTQSRFESLFNILGIENHSILGEQKDIDIERIIDSFDWTEINKKIEEEKQKAEKWMAMALAKPSAKKENYDLVNTIISKNYIEQDRLKRTANYSIFKENQLKQSLGLFLNRKKIYRKYYTYKLLSNVLTGTAKNKYKQKRAIYKQKINSIRELEAQLLN